MKKEIINIGFEKWSTNTENLYIYKIIDGYPMKELLLSMMDETKIEYDEYSMIIIYSDFDEMGNMINPIEHHYPFGTLNNYDWEKVFPINLIK